MFLLKIQIRNECIQLMCVKVWGWGRKAVIVRHFKLYDVYNAVYHLH